MLETTTSSHTSPLKHVYAHKVPKIPFFAHCNSAMAWAGFRLNNMTSAVSCKYIYISCQFIHYLLDLLYKKELIATS